MLTPFAYRCCCLSLSLHTLQAAECSVSDGYGASHTQHMQLSSILAPSEGEIKAPKNWHNDLKDNPLANSLKKNENNKEIALIYMRGLNL